ncbi:MAG TPA: alpha/beta hydrolase [Pseudomonadales bacterium]|nr:alpha/beta hydrolase [Pseudomonadales bacterium]
MYSQIIFKRLRAAIVLFASAVLALSTCAHAADGRATNGPHPTTVVLVHGAFADASSWNRVIPKLLAAGYDVVAVANPLRGLGSDSAYIGGLVSTIAGPVILVGHSYGGAVISNAAPGHDNVKALVFVAGFAPDTGESAFGLVGKFPGSTLGDALVPVELDAGVHDLYVKQAAFRGPFAADVAPDKVKLMAATQRPITDVAGNEPSRYAAWKMLPSWFIYGSADMSIPPAVHAFMAERAHARRIEVVPGASHVVMVSHPNEVVKMIREAADATRG